MRGEAEQKCFNLVKENLDYKNFFAMSYEERDLIKKVFEIAVPNNDLNAFPDFIFDDGFIEHFRVTSSFEGRKGSRLEIERAEIRKEFNDKVKKTAEDFAEDGVSIYTVSTTEVWHKTHSYENFIESLKSNLEHHLESMEKYIGNKNNKIFMVEYNDSALAMGKVYPKDLMQGVSYGDLMKRESPVYRPSRDINLLKYLYEKRESVDYIIFVNDDCRGLFVDIVKNGNALEIIKLLHEGYNPYCVMIGSSEFGIGVAVPNGKKE